MEAALTAAAAAAALAAAAAATAEGSTRRLNLFSAAFRTCIAWSSKPSHPNSALALKGARQQAQADTEESPGPLGTNKSVSKPMPVELLASLARLQAYWGNAIARQRCTRANSSCNIVL